MSNETKNKFTEDIVLQLYKKTKFYAVRSDIKNEVWVYENGIYTSNGECYIKEFVRGKMQDEYTTHFANIVIEKIVADNFIDVNEFFNTTNTGFICVKNGILNLKTLKIKQFTPNIIFFNKFDIKYDPNKDCKNIKKFIKSIVEDDSDYDVIQELFGDIIYTDYKWERCFMFLGNGRNGKSKLAELMKLFVGVKNVCSVHPSTLEDPNSFTISFFHSKLINLSMDINNTAFKKISVLKALSGRDPVTAPRKFMTPIVFRNYAKLVFGANNLPRTFETKDSFWERWILLEFPYTFTDKRTIDTCENESRKKMFKLKDPDIIEKIVSETEMAGLLNFAIVGLHRLLKNKTYSYKYTPEEVKSLWIRKSDSFGAFFLDYLELDFDCKVSKRDLRRMYSIYCKKHSIKNASDKVIKFKMDEEGVFDGRSRTDDLDDYVWEGVKFREDRGGITEGNGLSTHKDLSKTLSKFIGPIDKKTVEISEFKVIDEEII
jgi:putative DNA primase/helicase